MTKFFKPDDFAVFLYKEVAADIANDKLEREAKVVYSLGEPNWRWYTTRNDNSIDTHTALLINIEPIVKCTHPYEKVKPDSKSLLYHPLKLDFLYRCECGQIVRPVKFYEVEN